MICIPQIEKNEMGEDCSTCGGAEVRTGFWWGNLRERDPGIDGKIILRWIFMEWGGGGTDLIDLA